MIFFYFLVAIMPLTQHRFWGRTVGEFTVFKYIGASCVLYAVVRLAARRVIPPYFRTWQARLFVALYLIATASYFTKSMRGVIEFSPFLSYTSFLLLFFVTVTVVDSLRRLRWVIMVALGSVAFASLYLVREWQKYHGLYEGFRPGWVVGDPNYFTVSALLTLPIAFYLMLGLRRRSEQLFCAGCLVVTLIAVTLCASRGGFLGLVTAFVFAVWHSRERLRNLVLVSAMVLPLCLLMPVSPLQRLLHPNQSDKGGGESRIALWRAGVRMIETHPITGIGLGNFKPLVPEYEQGGTTDDHIAHNAYVEIAAEMGLPALFVFLGILFWSYHTLSCMRARAFHAGLTFMWMAALSLQAGLVGSAVAIFFVSGQYQKLLWLTVFLSICMPGVVRSNPNTHSRLEKLNVGVTANRF